MFEKRWYMLSRYVGQTRSFYMSTHTLSIFRLITRQISHLTAGTVRVKQPHYRPWQALSLPGVWGSQILRQSAHEGGKVVSPTHWPPLHPGNIPGTHFVRGWGHSAAGRIMSMKNSNDTIGNRSRDLPVCSAVQHVTRTLRNSNHLMLNGEVVAAHYKNQENSQNHCVPNAVFLTVATHVACFF
jgi:hypothetical protein